MDEQPPNGSRQLRARFVEARYIHRGGAWRIEDAQGLVLHTIRGARHAQEAMALYWRSRGAALPGAMMGNDLDRRIRGARAARNQARMPELPFDPAPAELGPSPPRRERTARSEAGAIPQTDLFDPIDPPPPDEPEPEEPAPAALPDPVAMPVPGPRLLDPASVMLQRVDPRGLRPTDRPDSYLYHVTNGTEAETALRRGIAVDDGDALLLTERQGVAYWLSMLAEEYDYLIEGPPDFAVLRLRRMAVEELIKPDPRASRQAGCPCFRLQDK